MKRTLVKHAATKNAIRFGLIATIILTTTLLTYGQGGTAGIQAADTEIRKYFGVGTQLMYGVGAILGLIGAIKVYQKWNSGDQDTSKVAASWFGSCIFLVVVATIIGAFFGVS